MREIRFRAWDENRKIMFQPIVSDLIIHLNGQLNSFDSGGELNGTEYTKQLPLMQYTGLHDKRGKEIFEGDWCKQKRHNQINYCIGYVAISPTQGVVLGNNGSWWPIWIHDVEIIGNNREDPYLLKGGFH
jgi:uncharacterized phage protein (TIGR01671 family)